MRIAYLTQLYPYPGHPDITIPPQITEAMAERGHQALVISVSDREYTYHIHRNNIIIVQLRSFRCTAFVGQQPVLLPFSTILQSLYRFRPDIIYMDTAGSMNWIGLLYSFLSRIPIRPTPQGQMRVAEQI